MDLTAAPAGVGVGRRRPGRGHRGAAPPVLAITRGWTGEPLRGRGQHGSAAAACHDGGVSDASGLPAGDPYDWFVRSRDLHAEGSAAAAAELLAHAVEQEPQARSLREAWARALFDARRYDDASREFLTLTEQAPDDHYAHFGAGLALWRLQRFSSAAEHLSIAVAMRPGRRDTSTPWARSARRWRRGPRRTSRWTAPCRAPPRARSPRPVRRRTSYPVLRRRCAVRTTWRCSIWTASSTAGRRRSRALSCASALRSTRRMRTAFVTNNAARPPAEVAAHLARAGTRRGRR